MNNIVIYGASGLGKEILQLLKVINNKKKCWNILGFIDDNKNINCKRAQRKMGKNAHTLANNEFSREKLSLRWFNWVIKNKIT